MTEFQGILIDEKILSDSLTFYSVFIPVGIVVLLILLGILWWMDRFTPEDTDEIEKSRLLIRHLEKYADNDPHIAKKLAKEQRNYAQLTGNRQSNRIVRYVLLGIIVLFATTCFLTEWIPTYQDIQHKDYVSYAGTFKTEYRRSDQFWAILPDGTWLELSGSALECAPREEGTYTGTLVYSSRSKLVLGIEWNENASP